MIHEPRTCQNCKQQFEIQAADFAFYAKVAVPPPTFCPPCRTQRRFAFRNERRMFMRKSDHSGKMIFSQYPPSAPFPVYERDAWYSDAFDPLKYARDYDFSRPFLEQFKELINAVPHFNLSLVNPENSDFCNNATSLKNCYLLFGSYGSEGCLYGNIANHSRDSVDNSHIHRNELCYENLMTLECYQCFSFVDGGNCRNVHFSKDCIDCSDCFGCVNLKHKQYCFWNEQLTKEEYFSRLKAIDLGSRKAYDAMRQKAQAHWVKFPPKFMHGFRNEDVSGDYIIFSKNVHESWGVVEAEDSKYCQLITASPMKDCYDYSVWGGGAELIYDSVICGNQVQNLKFCYTTYESASDMQYTYMCIGGSNLFGCAGMKKGQYRILNKQYTKEAYEALIPKIIAHMNEMPYTDSKGRIYKYGEFLPISFSPFAYNLTLANDFFPLSKEHALAQGYAWYDFEDKDYQPTMSWKDLPDNIKDVKDDITKQSVLCRAWEEDPVRAQEHGCTKIYRILPQELAWYRKLGLPIPDRCPYTRFRDRLRYRNGLELWNRQCYCSGEAGSVATVTQPAGTYRNQALPHPSHQGSARCPNTLRTSFAPQRPEMVYCESCYQNEVS